MPDYYMGVDPGPSTGIALFSIEDLDSGWDVFQCEGGSAFWLLLKIYEDYCPRVVAVEEFIPSNKAGGKGANAGLTRRLAEYAVSSAKANVKRSPAVFTVYRRAADVKPWATDKRLAKADFPWGVKFKDARDAGRHALYAAVRDGKERDPLA